MIYTSQIHFHFKSVQCIQDPAFSKLSQILALSTSHLLCPYRFLVLIFFELTYKTYHELSYNVFLVQSVHDSRVFVSKVLSRVLGSHPLYQLKSSRLFGSSRGLVFELTYNLPRNVAQRVFT